MILLALLVPAVLLMLTLAMQHIEQPLRDQAVGDRIVEAFPQVPADDIERLVFTHASSPVDRYWRRQERLARIKLTRATARN